MPMRALGPGLVSGFLKITLDTVFAALTIGVGVATLMTLASLVALAHPALMDAAASTELKVQGLNGPGLVIGLGTATIYIAGVLNIVGRLRRIFATLTAGDPLHPLNVRRLKVIGVMLGVLELGRYPFAAAAACLAPAHAWASTPPAGSRY